MKEKTKIEKIVKNMVFRNNNGNRQVLKVQGMDLHYSYNSCIVARGITGKIYIGKDAFYSMTTGKYRNEILGEQRKETEAKLKSGEYTRLEVQKK